MKQNSAIIFPFYPYNKIYIVLKVYNTVCYELKDGQLKLDLIHKHTKMSIKKGKNGL